MTHGIIPCRVFHADAASRFLVSFFCFHLFFSLLKRRLPVPSLTPSQAAGYTGCFGGIFTDASRDCLRFRLRSPAAAAAAADSLPSLTVMRSDGRFAWWSERPPLFLPRFSTADAVVLFSMSEQHERRGREERESER